MSPETKLALMKLFSEDEGKAIRDNIHAGSYCIDETIRIKGNLKVGEDYDREIPQKLCLYKLLKVTLNHLNKATVRDIVKEVLESPELLKEQEEELKGYVKKAIDDLTKSTKSKCKGQAKFKAEIFSSLSELKELAKV